MVYTIIFNGQSYDLPKKTLAIVAELDDALKVDDNAKLSIKQKYEKLHTFVKKIVGADAAKEIFGSDDLAEIDLSELAIIVKMIDDAYMRPLAEYATQKQTDELNALNIDKIDKIVELAKVAEKLPQAKK